MVMGKGRAAGNQVTSLAALCTMAALLGGCGGASGLEEAFTPRSPLRGAAARPLLERIDAEKRQPAIAGAVGVTGRGLVGRALPDGERWEQVGPVETLPALDGEFVAVSGGGHVRLHHLRDGKLQWSIDSEGRQLSAMAHDGQHALLVLTDPHDSRLQLVLIVDQEGVVRHCTRSEPALGQPTTVGGLGLVPWSGRYVTVIDLAQGEPLAQFLVENSTTTAVADLQGVLLLGRGVLRLSEDVLSAPRPHPLELPPKNLPGAPRWPTDGTVALAPRAFPVAIHAFPRIDGDRLRFAQDAFGAIYYRVVLGFGARGGELRWATHFLRDVLGAASSSEGMTLCLEDGSLWRLAWADGSRASSGTLGARLRACVVSPDPRPITVARPVPLAEQVATTLTDTGPDMAPVHHLLLDELAANPAPEVTRLLLEIARSPRASADLADQTARRIAMRRTGVEHLIAALEDGADFEVTKRPAPIAAIASALFAVNAKEGAPALAQHLIDPRTSMIDQLMLARVLRHLAGPEQVPELSAYFTLYRTAASEPELAQAVVLTAQTLWLLGGEEGRAVVLEAARDPMTHPNVRSELEKLMVHPSPTSSP